MQVLFWIFVAVVVVIYAIVRIVITIYRRSLRKDALSYYDVLRSGPTDTDHTLKCFWEKLKKSKYTLEQIGLSQEKLDEAVLENRRLNIVDTLEYARGTPIKAHYHVEDVRRDVKLYGFTLAKVGTNEDELKKLARRGRQVEFSIIVGRARKKASEIRWLFDELSRFIEEIKGNGEFTFAELGTTEQEIENFNLLLPNSQEEAQPPAGHA